MPIQVVDKLKSLAEEYKDISMLARTHGQPATPTNLGKEIKVWVERLEGQLPQPAAFGSSVLLFR